MHAIASDVNLPVVDWNTPEIIPIHEDQIGSVVPVVTEENLYAHIGLKDEDERTEKEKDRFTTEGIDEGAAAGDSSAAPIHGVTNVDLQEAAILVNDRIPGEDAISYDKEDPPIIVGSSYATMNEFRSAVRQHAIKWQFELRTEYSDTGRFRGSCTAEGCPWAIVARLMHDEKSVTVTMNNFDHLCASTGRVKTRMTTYHWVAEKAIPFFKKDSNMGAKKRQEALEDKYNVKLGYSTVWLGRQKAAQWHVVHLGNHTCSCREWLAYSGVIQLLIDKSQWPKVNLGFKLLPPLQKRSVGRQWKNRIKGCLEKGGSSRKDVKGKWQVLCKRCGERGHRDTSSKCRYNSTNKSRAKQRRPLGSEKEPASTSTPKRQKVAANESTMSQGVNRHYQSMAQLRK